MILGFKDQFVPYVEDGSKRHTIRGGERWKVGMRGDLYQRPRQKDMRLIFRAIVIRVERIEIRYQPLSTKAAAALALRIDGSPLVYDEANQFLWRDGFRKNDGRTSMMQAAAFWRKQLTEPDFWCKQFIERPFTGQVIHWDYEKRTKDK